MITNVTSGLFIGDYSQKWNELADRGIGVVVRLTTTGREAPKHWPGAVLKWRFPDIHELPDLDMLRRVVTFTANMSKDTDVLVQCAGAINRSALVIGCALVFLGNDSVEAIEAIQKARGGRALTNPVFRKYIQQY